MAKTKNPDATRMLVDAARNALVDAGFSVERGAGRSRIWEIDGILKGTRIHGKASVRTTRDRWFAFRPRDGGWQPLDHVDYVIVSAVDDPENPRNAEIYLFRADDVRCRFDEAYRAREREAEDGRAVSEGFNMWVALDRGRSSGVADVGSGLGDDIPHIDMKPLAAPERLEPAATTKPAPGPGRQRTIAEIRDAAQQEIAEIAGVPVEQVKIDVHIQW